MQTHTHTHPHKHTHPVPPPSALSGTSLNIHHSGCSESAVNAASHSRESLKPTLSSALPPSSLPLARSPARLLACSLASTHTYTHAHTHTEAHTFLATASHKDKLTCTNARKAQPVASVDAQTHAGTWIRRRGTHTRRCAMNRFCACACVCVLTGS